jgi:hypothetical protein
MNTIISPKEEKEKFCPDRGGMKMPARWAEETGDIRRGKAKADTGPAAAGPVHAERFI